MAVRANRQVLYDLGVEYSQILEPDCTYQAIGDALGISKQMAYHICMVALGKLVYSMKKSKKFELLD